MITASKWMELEDLNLAEERATQLEARGAEAEANKWAAEEKRFMMKMMEFTIEAEWYGRKRCVKIISSGGVLSENQ